MTVQEFCIRFFITENQFYGIEKIRGTLDLSDITSIPEGFNPTVSGSLYLDSLTSIPEGFNPTVGESLWLRRLKRIPEGFNPTVGGTLRLDNLTIVPEVFNPTVGKTLRLDNMNIVPEGFNPTVGGNLYLTKVMSIPKVFNPTVGGAVYSRFKIHTTTPEYPIKIQNSKYILVDGILVELLNKRKNIYTCKRIDTEEIVYIVQDGSKFAHGSTIKEAKADLLYKIGNRDKSDFENLELEDTLTFEEAVECYRVITGACSFGTREFVEKRLKQTKLSYTVLEIIELTENEYGGKTFREFFVK